MPKSFSVLALVFCGLWSASQPAFGSSLCTAISPNLVTNCGFETGDFTGWTTGGNVLNPGGNYYGVDAFDANSGNYGAFLSQDFIDGGTAELTLSQTLATVVGQLYTVSFWLEQDTTPTTGYTHLFNAAFGGTTMLNLAPTVALPGTVGVFTQYSYAEMATATSTALTFSIENDDNYWSFDDVSVSPSTSAPEPSTGLLGGMALGGVLLMFAREKRAASRRPN
jgi:hypothetical protein